MILNSDFVYDTETGSLPLHSREITAADRQITAIPIDI